MDNVKEDVEPPDRDWRRVLAEGTCSPKKLSEIAGISLNEMKQVCEKYPAFVNSYYLSLIKEKDDPIFKQCIPCSSELNDSCEEDPLNEDPEHQARKGVPELITHRYPDRVLFRVSNMCAMYCRFCTRKRKVGDENKQPTEKQYVEAIKYIKEHEEIRDVLLSGGDPLMLSDGALDKILTRVYDVIRDRENSMIRIGTRVVCVLPQRITTSLCKILEKYHPLFINTHFNHPDELTPEAKRASSLLLKHGIPLGCQTVLLKGINDDPEVMKKLMQKLISFRIRPYYLYQADPVKGTDHFRTKVEKGLEIYKAIRGHTTGLCVPNFVIDAPGGGGKIPLLPEYLQEIGDDEVVLKNYEGKVFKYPQVDK